VRALFRYVPLQYSTVHLFLTHVRLSRRRVLSASSVWAYSHEKALIACWMFVQRRSLLYAYFRDRFLSVSPSALQRRHPQLCSVDRGNTRMQTGMPTSWRLRSFYKNNCKRTQPFQDHGEQQLAYVHRS
jgi:hypothetical protein